MWSPTVSSDELYHHGILKMKWGVRNGPPYPLSPDKHSAAEKKANGIKTKKSDTDSGKAATKRKFNLSEDQKSKLKKAAIGAAVVGGVAIGAYAAYKLNTPEFKTMVKAARNNMAVDDYIKTMSDKELKKLVGPTKGQKFQGALADIAGKDVKGQVKAMNYSKTQDKAFNEMVKRMNANSDPIAKKTANNVTKIPTGASRVAHDVKKTATTTAKAATDTVKKAASSGPKLEFGSSISNSQKDLETIMKAAKILNDMANSANNQSKKSTGQKKYTDDLLNKNNGRLANMSMEDLKKLDLY